MKKAKKKLVLAKETVRSLESLLEVRGGSDWYWSCKVCYEEEISYNYNC